MTANKATNPAARIRKALKTELGLTARQVSVRSSRGSISVTIKAPGIKIADVKRLAQPEERISGYDQATGCMLRGGNLFVSVSLDYNLTDGPAAAIRPWLAALETGNRIHSVPGTESIGGLGVSRDDEWWFGLWRDDQAGCLDHSNLDGIAHQLAARFVEAGIEVNV